MLTLIGNSSHETCDGVTRRSLLRVGALGMGGLALPQFLQAQSESKNASSDKAVIMIYLGGGPSHLDMYDIKEEAPSNIRGEFAAISTKVPGIRVSEHMPRIAANMDKFAVLRSIVDSQGSHSSFQCETGQSSRNQPPGGWPAIGSVLSKLQGTRKDGVPAYIAQSNSRAGAGFLGPAYKSFSPKGKGKADMVLNPTITEDRLEDRKVLLSKIDDLKRSADSTGLMDGIDKFNQKAFEIVTSSELIDALDIKKADARSLERYTKSQDSRSRGTLQQMLTARRLVEAGARCVTLSVGGWDTHQGNFDKLAKLLPVLDHGVACMVEDLHDRGMEKDVSVIVWGEFGRTPKVNGKAGRDHWPRVMSALVAGGGMRTGQVVGETDRLGGEAAERPIKVGEVFSTLYRNCGIDAAQMTLTDHAGRPQYLVKDQAEPMSELI